VRSFIALVAFALFASAATYTLKPGDTLGSVAHKHHVSIGALAAANHIKDPNRVYAGQTLVIPGAIPGAVLISAHRPAGTHVVRTGETLGAIAHALHVTTAALAKANGITDPNRIRVGQSLVVPGGGGGVRSATWVCPVAGRSRFIDDFGAPRSGGRRHMGIDLLATRGTPVVATVSGLLKLHPNKRGGNAYYLEGDDGRIYYGAHLATFNHRSGRIRIGQIIGTVGDTGNARGGPTHLHFEVGENGANKDPYPLLARACQRA
jgi:murein DD-endopeptidase MepM/ murein hydrolase activator NlpD